MHSLQACYKYSTLIVFLIYFLSAQNSTAHAQAWNSIALIKRPVVNMCALTFDDGPSQLTPQLLDTLKEEGVVATFFVLGEQVARRPEVLQRIIAEGHEIGNHTYTHPDMLTISNQQQRAEMQKLNNILKTMGVKPRFFRPPYGSYNKKLTALVEDMGMDVMMWSTDSRDWQRKPDYSNMPNALERTMQPEEMRGVFLFHDTKKRTVRDIGLIILILRTMGCERFVTVSEYIDAQEENIMVAALPMEERASTQKYEFFSEEFRNTFSIDPEYGANTTVQHNALTLATPSSQQHVQLDAPILNTDIASSIADTPPVQANTSQEQNNTKTQKQPEQLKTQDTQRQLIADEEAYMDSSIHTEFARPPLPHSLSTTPRPQTHILGTQLNSSPNNNLYDAGAALRTPSLNVPYGEITTNNPKNNNKRHENQIAPVANNKEITVTQ